MSTMKLYEIANEYRYILNNYYDPETGEVDESSFKKIDEIKESLEKKCIAVASYIENLKAECNAISEAKKRMADRESKFKKQLDGLKEYLLHNMEKSELKKISCTYFDISVSLNPPKVDIYDEDIIPLDYDKVEIKKDVAKIRQDLLSGVSIPGAKLVQGNSLRIK